MSIPPDVNFYAVTDEDSPSAFAAAAAEIARRDALWRSRPCLADECEHDWRCLPVVEFRQTVVCAKCGGFNKDLSRELTERPDLFAVGEDGSIARVTITVHDSAALAAHNAAVNNGMRSAYGLPRRAPGATSRRP